MDLSGDIFSRDLYVIIEAAACVESAGQSALGGQFLLMKKHSVLSMTGAYAATVALRFVLMALSILARPSPVKL
jgi:hypothetical protein